MDANSQPGRPRGRGRGGRGKYLRARGRRGTGRPAEFRERLLLEDEQTEDIEADSEYAKELERKYGKRKIESQVSRLVGEQEARKSELPDGEEEEEEPEVDLTTFLARQRLSDPLDSLFTSQSSDKDDGDGDEEIDTSLVELTSKFANRAPNLKGKVKYVEWDEETQEMFREQAVVDANRDLKARFRAKTEKQTARSPTSSRQKPSKEVFIAAPRHPIDPAGPRMPEKEEMQTFLDDLLD